MSSLTGFTITLTDGETFTIAANPTFQVDIIIDGILGTSYTATATPTNPTTATGVPNNPITLTPGAHTIELRIDNSFIATNPELESTVGTVRFNFITPTANFTYNLTYIPDEFVYTTGEQDISIACLHANSIIVTTNGDKYIKNIAIGDHVLTSNGQYAAVVRVAHCWIQHPGPSHDAVIFEPYSLTESLPSVRLIIDPGHPIKINKEDEFQPAGKFVNDNNIFVRKWTDELVQNPTPSLRWDLVLEDGYDNYIANGVIVKSRDSVDDPGYLHRYFPWT